MFKKKKYFSFVMVALGFLFFAIIPSCNNSSKEGELFSKRLNYQIVVPHNPSNAELFSAKELTHFLSEIYSEPIVHNGTKSDITFFIKGAKRKDVVKYGFKDGAFGILKKNNKFIFTGYDAPNVNPQKEIKLCAGTATSVYYFLTKYLEVSFYFPGDNGYKIKKNIPFTFSRESDIPKPSFIVRGVSIKNKSYSTEQNILFARRSLSNIPYWAKKDYYYYYLNKWKTRFEKTKPEYLGLYNGKRYSGKYPYHLPCFSNPAVLKQSVDDILNALRNDSTIKTVRIFADCPLQFCQCEKCMAMPERKYIGETKENGEMVYGIVKKIMDEVHKTEPHIQFLVQTKLYTNSGSYFKPPKLVEMGHQCTILHLVRRNRMPVFDHTKEVEIAKQWLADSVKIVLKSYERYPEAKDYPLIKPHLDKDFFNLFLGIASGTTNSEASDKAPYSFSALGQYLQLKMLFNIDVDIDKEIGNFCAFAYPGAEKEMMDFYSYIEKIYSKRKEFSKPLLEDVYSIDKLTVAKKMLDSAALKISSISGYFNELYDDFDFFYNEAQALIE